MRNRSLPHVGPLPVSGAAVRLRKSAGGPVHGTVVGHRPMYAEKRGELLSLGLGVLVQWHEAYRSLEAPDDIVVTA